MYRLGNFIYCKPMSRKMYAIWLAVLFVLIWPWASMKFGVGFNFEELIVTLLFCTLLFTCPLVVVSIGMYWISCIHVISDLWMYLFNADLWLKIHSHSIGVDLNPETEKMFLWENDILPLLITLYISILVALHFWFSVKRCKRIGINLWWAVVPIYNPFVLLIRK